MPPGVCAKLAVGAITGTTSAIAAAVLKTLRLFIFGSICGTQSNRLKAQTFPSLALIVRDRSVTGRNCTWNEWIASTPRQSVAANLSFILTSIRLGAGEWPRRSGGQLRRVTGRDQRAGFDIDAVGSRNGLAPP